MREYEVTVIFQPKLSDDERTELIERVTGWLTFGEEEADKPVPDHWGLRKMAYDIDDHSEGYYILYNAKLDPLQIHEIERNMLYTEDVLRYLVLRK